ncbi:tetratricopeptide repeat protein 7B-like isoform X2 [Limulus polyphemus]|uniref:Tetratricopeptide repeat protein 7B-like isoform X2 n=1 Tax=Limulus polyphemus TaxID=6850 RepID=A0ABM1T215_LIMPO|nr:tetratricopeptide repeat protein 7B-like isoform X2 [Limulus polyphemus]
MAYKPKVAGRLEIEIDKHREESNWKKVLELADQLSQRTTGFETLVSFLIGESKLEQHLEQYAPTEQNIPRARTGLTDSKRYLQSCLGDQGRNLNLVTDAHLLLAKLLYAQGSYEESVSQLGLGGLDGLTQKQLSNRNLKIVAESFAVKGLCLEKIPLQTTSKNKAAERDEQVINCLVQAGELALRYLQEIERTQGHSGGSLPQLSSGATTSGSGSPLPPNTEYRIGYILETALQRAPILLIRSGKLYKAVEQYRNVLSAVETSSTQSLRQTMSRQLAEVLLRGVCEKAYNTHLPITENQREEGPWKPLKYTGQSLFVPKDENEEILLLLFISEAMAVRNAVLDRSPEFRDIRIHSYHNVTAVYDLLTIALARRAQFSVLCESFEGAMKFSFEEYHIWFQFALSLISAGKHGQGFLVLQECARLQPSGSLPSLLAARLCYEHLGQPEQGLKMAHEALDRERSHPQGLLCRCYLAVGLGHHLLAEQARPQPKKQAQSSDPNDHLPEFYLALHYAQARQLTEAVQHAKMALHLRSEHIGSLHLLVLLLSAQKQYSEALQLVEAALEEYPRNLNLLYTKAYLEEHCMGGDVALLTSKEMLQHWKVLYDDELKRDMRDSMQRVASESRSMFQVYSSEFSDRDSGSPATNSVAAASRIEQALSEVASSISGFHPRPGPQSVWILQLHIWLLIAEVYLHLGQVSEAEACVHEASSIFPLSHQLMVMKGLIHEHKGEFYEAKTFFQNAIAVNPLHVKAMQHLGLVYHRLGSCHLAEKTLREAVTIDPVSHQSWYNMGQVLQEMGQLDMAGDCLATAIELEATSPILPFSVVPHTLE